MQILSCSKGQQVESYFVDLNLLAPLYYWSLWNVFIVYGISPTNIELSCCDICIYQRMNNWTLVVVVDCYILV